MKFSIWGFGVTLQTTDYTHRDCDNRTPRVINTGRRQTLLSDRWERILNKVNHPCFLEWEIFASFYKNVDFWNIFFIWEGWSMGQLCWALYSDMMEDQSNSLEPLPYTSLPSTMIQLLHLPQSLQSTIKLTSSTVRSFR